MVKIFFLLNLLLFTSFSNAQLIFKALCSNGEQATFTFFEGNTNNWLIYIQGGVWLQTKTNIDQEIMD